MYDEELTFTGLGSFAIGGLIFDAAWVVLAGALLTMASLLLLRIAVRNTGGADREMTDEPR